MKIITGSSKVVQGTGDTKSATVSYEFGVKGSEQKRVCDGYIGQGTVLGSAEHADRLHDASKGAEGRAVATSHAEAAAVLCVVCRPGKPVRPWWLL